MTPRQPAVFFSYANSLEAGGGGVQRCTREYQAILTSAGFDLSPEPYFYDRRLSLRIIRRLRPRPYALQIPAGSAEKTIAHADRMSARWIFLNHSDAAPLAAQINALAPGRFRFCLLSHGADSTDYLHEVRIQKPAASRREKLWLGEQLFAEMSHRPDLDAVLCLSEMDLHLERWLGANNALFLPQFAAGNPLLGRPVKNRVGTVCTLPHAPNFEGIKLIATALKAYPDVRLRLIGRPPELGKQIAAEFPNIEYLGPLSDDELEAEAATWSCFVNPIFCYPRGASTKLAQALGWRLPIATTRAGIRGYYWDESLIAVAETPAELARQAAALARLDTYEAARQNVAALVETAPDTHQVARQVAVFLRGIA